MRVKRGDPANVAIAGGTADDVERFLDNDLAIRSGNCPNGCGKLEVTVEPYIGQECSVCKFSCNTMPEISQ